MVMVPALIASDGASAYIVMEAALGVPKLTAVLPPLQRRRRNEFPTTKRLLTAMAPAATTGLIVPVAAIGTINEILGERPGEVPADDPYCAAGSADGPGD